MNMDVESFDILVERMIVVAGKKKIEALWSRFAGAQGTQKGVKGMAKDLDPERLLKKRKARTP